MYGNQSNIIDFLEASDLLVQPSIEESSNQTIKEAALYKKLQFLKKYIMMNYIEDKKNAFLFSKNKLQKIWLKQQIYNDKYNLKKWLNLMKLFANDSQLKIHWKNILN